MTKTTYLIDGMTCDGCVASLRIALGRVDGIAVEDIAVGRATVRHEQGKEAQVVEAVEDAGFEVSGHAASPA